MGVARPAAMMDEADNRLNSKKAEALQTLIVPAPVRGKWAIRCDRFPKHGIPQCPYSQRRDSIQVAKTAVVSGLCDLVSVRVTDPDQRTFEAAPELKIGNRA
jgi:hypothetical protein